MKKGDLVFVDFSGGAEYENYTGHAVFLRSVSADDSSCQFGSAEPHCIVQIDDSDPGSAFPESCVFLLNNEEGGDKTLWQEAARIAGENNG